MHHVPSIINGRYSQKHASDYTRYDATRMKKAVSLLEDDVLEVFSSEYFISWEAVVAWENASRFF